MKLWKHRPKKRLFCKIGKIELENSDEINDVYYKRAYELENLRREGREYIC